MAGVAAFAVVAVNLDFATVERTDFLGTNFPPAGGAADGETKEAGTSRDEVPLG
jgi:hypothetical protein